MTHSPSLFSFKSYEPCCFIHQFVDVTRKLSHLCEMTFRSKAIGPRYGLYIQPHFL